MKRLEPLLPKQFVTADRVEEARTQRATALEALNEARAHKRAAVAVLASTRAQHVATEAALQQARSERVRAKDAIGEIEGINARIAAAEAAVHAAELDLSYCRVQAPFTGLVVNMNISNGFFARAGVEVFTLVDTRTWFVVANFRETQLRHIPFGAPADLYLLSQPAQALSRHRRRTRLGGAAGERHQRQWPAGGRPLPRLDSPGGALSGAYKSGESGRLLSPGRLCSGDGARQFLAHSRAMSPAALLDFLRRELSPTPGRGGATFRLTLAAIATTIPILTHHIPHGLVALIMLYLVTREDTAATLIGSIFGWVGVTIGFGVGLLACKISLDIPELRFCLVGLFFFGGLFLKSAIALPGLGTAIGVPLALSLIIPDLIPPSPEQLVYFILWLWCCVTIGMSVNAGVQLLLNPGDPLMLLRRELDTRLLAVEQALRRLAGNVPVEPPPMSLETLGIVGMSRPLALLKSASMTHRWARERHERLTAIITLVDRLVTSAIALEAVAPPPEGEIHRERLLKVADACDRTRQAFAELRLPSPSEWIVLAAKPAAAALSPLADMERTLDEITLAVPGRFKDSGESGAQPPEKLRLFLPDAFTNPEHVHFAVKGALAAFICYVIFVGFDYPGIYTCVITVLVVSLSTIGASNQKGILRFGGAAVGGGMAMVALMYLFPNVETIGGFWLIFGAGTAVAAWATFGTPRIFYGGYQVGLAFYKASPPGFWPGYHPNGHPRSSHRRLLRSYRVRHRGACFCGPCALQTPCARDLAELLRLLGELARTGPAAPTPTVTGDEVDAWRRRISQKVQDVQELIESSKFELVSLKVSEIQKLTGEAQIIFILLLSLARQRREVTDPSAVRAAAVGLDDAMATALQALSRRIATDSPCKVTHLEGMLRAFDQAVSAATVAPGEKAVPPNLTDRLALYGALVTAIKRLASEPINACQEAQEMQVLAVQE